MLFNDMVDTGYFMYMAEAEGHDSLVNTRTAKINAVIKDLKYIKTKVYDPNPYIEEVLNRHGLTESMLSDYECEKISREVNRG